MKCIPVMLYPVLFAGIALLHLSFVDGLGHPITLLSCPKPSPLAYRDTFDSSMFPSMVDVQVYHDSTEEPLAVPHGGVAAGRKNSPKLKSPGEEGVRSNGRRARLGGVQSL